MEVDYKKTKGEIVCQAPSNIAFVKYWGKKEGQMPCNPSLSLTLKNAYTKTSLKYEMSSKPKIEYLFEGEESTDFEKKVKKYLDSISNELWVIKDYSLQFNSLNTFPHSTGIASSASAFAAIALCLVQMEKEVTGGMGSNDAFYKRASYFARLGSGSACRSVFEPFAVWGKNNVLQDATDEFAVPVKENTHVFFNGLNDAILIVNSEKKSVSSTAGHALMNNHPFAKERFKQANLNLKDMLIAMQTNNQKSFIDILENEALTLHAMMMTSNPSYLLLQPNTVSIIEKIKNYRKENNSFIGFTIDAGPNIHLIYHVNDREKVLSFIRKDLLPYCENEMWIDDGQAI